MASSKTFLFLLALVFTLVILIFSEVSARELTETANQVEKNDSIDNKDPHDKRNEGDSSHVPKCHPYSLYCKGGSGHVGKRHPCHDPHQRNCKVGGEHGSNNRGGSGGSHERHGEHGPHNHRGEEGGSHERYNGGGKGSGCGERGRRYGESCGHGGKGKGGHYDRPGGPGSDDETETRN